MILLGTIIGDWKKAREMRIRLSISVADRSQITDLPLDTKILRGRATWRNPPSILLILRDFDYLPRFFSVSATASGPVATVLQDLLSVAIYLGIATYYA